LNKFDFFSWNSISINAKTTSCAITFCFVNMWNRIYD
jgi:hypothetical protein